MMRALLIAAIASAVATAGCSRSPRVDYFTLLPASTAGAPAPARAVPSVAVGPVTLPEVVDRPQLVVRAGTNRVEILEAQRWAEPLKDGIPRYLAQEIGKRLGSSRVSSYQQFTGPAADYRVVVDFLRFESVPGEAVTVDANWTIRRGSATPPATGHFLRREKIRGTGYDALVAAYSGALSALSDELARAIVTSR